MSETVEQMAENVAQDLQGTCVSMEQALDRRDYDEGLVWNAEFLAVIDQLVFCCEVCDWWCELSEMAHEGTCNGICDDCYDEEED